MQTLNASGRQRRKLLQTFALLGITPTALFNSPLSFAVNAQNNTWISAQGDATESFGLGWVSDGEAAIHNGLSGFRGHGLALHPTKADTALMFARRPGTQVIEVNLRTGAVQQAFQCQVGHHLFGHGCFSADGSILFTSEGDSLHDDGKIVLRDSQNYTLLGEYESYGIGPHEIKLHPDGKTLVIANGGILTHPDSGREKLNLDTMSSNLTYLDAHTGKLLECATFDEPKASIRHIDVANDGTVAMAIQVQREAMSDNHLVALSAIHKAGRPIEPLQAPAPLLAQMQDYMGSVAINSATRIAGFTSPRGNVACFWHLDNKALVGYHRLHDVCGLAVTPDAQYFAITNSKGEMRLLDSHTLKEATEKRRQLNASWDNHLLITRL